MLFLDGVGIGRKDASVNPFFHAHLPALRSLCDGGIPSLRHRQCSTRSSSVIPLDATLGVDGLPQSGTGQTALFTGVNGPKLAGKHFGPHPYSSLMPVIKERNIFRQLLTAGKKPYFANAFPQRFFDYAARRPSRLTVTTLSVQHSGLQLLRADDLSAGRGVSADITSAGWHDLGYPEMRIVEPREAGHRLARLTAENDFVLFEYWKTDHAGHSQSMREAVEVLERFDGMLLGVLESLDVRRSLLVVTSDHGNLEDLSVKSHTRNPVPAILHGLCHEEVAARLHRHPEKGGDLTRVTPTLMDFLTTRSL